MPWNVGWPSGKPMPPAARGGDRPHRQRWPPRPARWPRPRRRWRRCRGRRRAPGCAPSASRCARSRTTSGSAVARPVTDAADRVLGRGVVDLGTSQSSIGIETKTGPAGGSAASVDGARQRQRDVLGPRRLVAPLHQRVRHPRGVAVGQVGLQRDQLARLLAGGDDQRGLVGLGVEDRAHGVADAGRGVQVDQRRAPAGLGVAVGHADDHGLLEGEDVAEVARGSRPGTAARSSPGCRTRWSSRAGA